LLLGLFFSITINRAVGVGEDQSSVDHHRRGLVGSAGGCFPGCFAGRCVEHHDLAALRENHRMLAGHQRRTCHTLAKGALPGFVAIGDFDAVALSESLLDVFNSNSDPRASRYARPDNDDYQNPTFTGAVNGSNSVNCSKIGSRLGAAYFDDPAQTTAAQLGLGTAEGIIMTYAEVEFLLAEAAAKGWISDDVEGHYKAGIQASMDYYQVDYAPFGYTDFEDFYANSGVAYSEVTDIWEQKWIALFFTGLEPYYEVRRWYVESGESFSGIPFLEPACENLNNDNLPLRFLYPGEEISLNTSNYEEAVNRLGENSQNAKMWLVE